MLSDANMYCYELHYLDLDLDLDWMRDDYSYALTAECRIQGNSFNCPYGTVENKGRHL